MIWRRDGTKTCADISDFSSFFSTIADRRGRQGREHILAPVLFVTFATVLAGGDDADAVVAFLEENKPWFRQFVILPAGIAAHDMVLRALALVDPDELELIIGAWVHAMRAPGVLTSEGRHVAFDGKFLRGSLDNPSGLRAVHMVGAYLIDAGLTLGTIKVDDKSNDFAWLRA